MKIRYHNSRDNLDQKQIKKQQVRITEKSFLKGVLSKAKNFIKDKAKDIKKSAKNIFRQIKKDFMASKSRSKFEPGTMIAMNYKAKDATKRYDKTPLIICLGWSQNPKLKNTHLFGLNMHWMKMSDRIKLASFFTELNEKKGGITYQDVKPFMHKFKGSPILRMYIYKNISGKVIDMPKDQFMTAAAVPSETWMGG